MEKRCAPADIFALEFRAKFTQNDLAEEEVNVWASKTFGEAEENINLPFSRSLNVKLLLDIKQSLDFFPYLALRGCSTFAKFAYFEVRAKPLVGEIRNFSISREIKFTQPFKLHFRK